MTFSVHHNEHAAAERANDNRGRREFNTHLAEGGAA